jgi:hypothetical protein
LATGFKKLAKAEMIFITALLQNLFGLKAVQVNSESALIELEKENGPRGTVFLGSLKYRLKCRLGFRRRA